MPDTGFKQEIDQGQVHFLDGLSGADLHALASTMQSPGWSLFKKYLKWCRSVWAENVLGDPSVYDHAAFLHTQGAYILASEELTWDEEVIEREKNFRQDKNKNGESGP